MVYTGANIAFSRVLNPLTLYFARWQIKQKPRGPAGPSVFDVRVAENQATGLLLFDIARVNAKESFIRRGSLGSSVVWDRIEKGWDSCHSLSNKWASCLQVALWETCMQVNSYKCRDVRGYSLIVSELERLVDLIRSHMNTAHPSFYSYCRNRQELSNRPHFLCKLGKNLMRTMTLPFKKKKN